MLPPVVSLGRLIKAHRTIAVSTLAVLLITATALAAPAIIPAHKPAGNAPKTLAAKATPTPTSTPSATATPSPSATPAPAAARAAAVKAVVTVPKVSVPSKALPTGTPSPITTSPSPSPSTPAQVWFYQYGYSTFMKLYNQTNQLDADVNAPDGFTPKWGNISPVAQDCQELSGTAYNAEHEAGIPDGTLNTEMLTDLTNIQQGSQNCAAGLETGNSTQATSGITQMGTGLTDYFQLVASIVPAS